jgi:hypothetical protein
MRIFLDGLHVNSQGTPPQIKSPPNKDGGLGQIKTLVKNEWGIGKFLLVDDVKVYTRITWIPCCLRASTSSIGA